MSPFRLIADNDTSKVNRGSNYQIYLARCKKSQGVFAERVIRIDGEHFIVSSIVQILCRYRNKYVDLARILGSGSVRHRLLVDPEMLRQLRHFPQPGLV